MRRTVKYRKIILICVSLCGVLLINGCVYHPAYPQTWSNVPEIPECPNVEGCYEDTGETSRDYKPSLYKTLIADDMVVADAVAFIKITQKQNELLIEAHSKNSLIKKRVFYFDTKNCKNGFIHLKAPNPERGINREGVFGYEWDSFRVSKAADGSLVIRHDSTGGGIVLLLPLIGTQWDWYRFSQVEPQ